MKNNIYVIALVAILIGAGAGFFGGMMYQKSQAPVRGNGQFGNRAAGGTQRNGANDRPVMGQIISMDEKSITVKMQDGSSKIVILPDSVTVSKTDAGSKTDLKVGETVGVFGTSNSDGSITAQNVQLRAATASGSPR